MATLINNVEHVPHKESLCRLILFQQETNQSRKRMIEISKILRNSEWVNGEQFFTVSFSTGIGDIK